MKSLAQLERLWAQAARSPRGRGSIQSICIRRGGGVHDLLLLAELSLEQGVVGDSWRLARDPARLSQVTLMNATVAGLVAHSGAPASDAGDNFLVDLDLSEAALPAGTRLMLGSALCRVSPKPHMGCAKFRRRFGADAARWVNHERNTGLRLRGVNLSVLEGGLARLGDSVLVLDGPAAAAGSAPREA